MRTDGGDYWCFCSLADALHYLQKGGRSVVCLNRLRGGGQCGLVAETLVDLLIKRIAGGCGYEYCNDRPRELAELALPKSHSAKANYKLLELGNRGIEIYFQTEGIFRGNSTKDWSVQKRKLILATHNQGKVAELQRVLASFPLEIISLRDLSGLPAVPETGSTFEENALLKAETISRLTGEMVLADDSGLEVASLQGKPGIFSARFAGESATDEENNTYLLKLMAEVPPQERKARFVCAMALAVPGQKTAVVEGGCEGFIAAAPRGNHGFGYDPLFIFAGEGQTFAEMEPGLKNRVSHRGQALEKIKKLLASIKLL